MSREPHSEPNSGLMGVLPHLVCCGLPLVIIAIAAGGLPVLGGVGIVVAIAALVLGVLLWGRRCRACAPARPEDAALLAERHERPSAPRDGGERERVGGRR
jgi:hypothetical protein